MKRLYYLLLALPLLCFVACDSDDDLPEVTFNMQMSGGLDYDGEIYIVQGDTLRVEALTVTPTNAQNTVLGATTYFWNGYPVLTTVVAPYKCEFYTAGCVPGAYALQARTNVYQVDKTIAVAWLSYRVNIVATEDDLPDDGTQTDMVTVKPQMSRQQ
jgi:hypothetical protein